MYQVSIPTFYNDVDWGFFVFKIKLYKLAAIKNLNATTIAKYILLFAYQAAKRPLTSTVPSELS